MTHLEQLQKWVGGQSVHNDEFKECCPDFSCCKPELLADEKTRMEFATAYLRGDEDTRVYLLGKFMAKLLESEGKTVLTLEDDKYSRVLGVK